VWGVIDRGELSIRVLSKNGEELQLWRFVESVGNFWNAAQATIQLPNSYNNFQIVLQGNDHTIINVNVYNYKMIKRNNRKKFHLI
jgi:hypothetical protein